MILPYKFRQITLVKGILSTSVLLISFRSFYISKYVSKFAFYHMSKQPVVNGLLSTSLSTKMTTSYNTLLILVQPFYYER